MATPYESVFSDYEIRKMSIKVGDGEFKACDCVGSLEEELNTISVTKKCRGMVAKTRVRGAGDGTLTLSCHMPWDIYVSLYSMDVEGLADGVHAYGRNSVHKTFTIVLDTYDEDGVEKFRAYPACIMTSGLARKVENGAEEVAELEMEISVTPDADGNCVYDCMVSELGEDKNGLKSKWMTAWTPELVKATAETKVAKAK